MVKRSTLVLRNAWFLAALSVFAFPDRGDALSEGDIALIGMQTAGETTGGPSYDSFTFVTLVDLEPGTRVYFTDNGYMGIGGFNGVTANDLNGAEGLAFFEVNAGYRLRAGSVFSSVSLSDPSFVWRRVNDQGVASSPPAGTSVLSLNNGSPGDQIYAFQSSATNPLPDTNSQQHLSAISTNPNWTYVGGSSSSSFSAMSTGTLPSNLTVGDPVVYSPLTFQSGAVYFNLGSAGNQLRTKEEWWTALGNDNSFWSSNSSSSFALPTTAFKMSGGIDLSWNGGSGTWDTASANWKDTSGNTTRFLPMDNAAFGGTAGGAISVEAAGVTAGSFVINNSGTSYSFTGGSITANSLVKSGAGAATVNNTLSLTGSVTVDSGTLTLTGNNTYNGTTLNGGLLVAGSNTALGAGAVTFNGGSLASDNNARALGNALVVNNTAGNTVSGGNNLSLTGGATGPGTLQVALADNANTLTVSGSTFAPGEIDVNKGSLLLGASNVLGDITRLRLSGGTLNTGGFSDSVGALTLSFDSTIDLGNGSSILQFASSRGETWTGVLLIDNWSGSTSGGGVDRIFFGSSFSDEANAGITLGQSAAIFFYNPEGLPSGYYSAQMLSSGELVPKDPVPVPEVNTIYAGGALVAYLICRRRRRRR
ncbi:hypothetical protein ACXR0O_09310 [Verrucomicrobiota bacterium sgz303538]